MEITEKQLSQLREKLGDKELKEIGIELPVQFNETKIYAHTAYGEIYKIHRLWDETELVRFAWININDSVCLASGSNIDVEKEIKKKDVHIFDNVKDFANWILKVTK